MIQSRREMEALAKRYHAQIEELVGHVEKWTAEHGDDAVVYLVRVPIGAGVISTITNAIHDGLIAGSPAAEELARYVVAQYPKEREPTWNQLRAAIHRIQVDENEDVVGGGR